MRYSLFFYFLVLSIISTAQEIEVKSGLYKPNDHGVDLFEPGKTTDLELLDVKLYTLGTGKSNSSRLKADEELIIVRSGQLEITIGKAKRILGKGSIASAVPGEKCVVTNKGKEEGAFGLSLQNANE